MKSSFLCVIGLSLFAQTQPFVVYNSMSLLFNSMYSGLQKFFLNVGEQIPASRQEEPEDSYPNNSGGEIYVMDMANVPNQNGDILRNDQVFMTTEKTFAASSEVIKTYDACFNRVNVKPESIAMLNRGHWREEIELKLWVHCVLVQNNLMTNQSVFRLDVAFHNVSDFERPNLEAKIDKCLPTTAMEPLDISWHFARCYQRENRARSLF